MSGIGNSQLGLTTPFGIGTPDDATPPPTNPPQAARFLDPISKDYTVGADGEYLRMPVLRQRVLLALGTVFASSSVQPTAGLKLSDRVDSNFEQRTVFSVKSALSFLVTSGELRIDNVAVTQGRPGRTRIVVSYTDLITGESDFASDGAAVVLSAAISAITCTITSPGSGSSLTVGAPVTIVGTISQPAGSVVLKLGSTIIGAATIIGLTWSCSFTPTSAEIGAQTINATATATGGSVGNAPGVPVSIVYTGVVAGRVIVPNTTLSAGSYNFQKSITIEVGAGLSLNAIAVDFANFYGASESSPGGILTANAQIEYPAGNFSRITFGGSNTGTVADGGTLVSDMSPLSTPIPHGAKAVFHGRVQNPSAVPWCNTLNGDVASGDALTLNSADLTGTTLTDTLGGSMFPLAFRGVTSLNTYAIIGDSIAATASDTAADSTGHRGFLARALASLGLAYVNMAVAGDTISGFLANSTKRRAEIARCNPTRIICEYGTNDLNPGILNHSAATVETDLNSGRALFAGIPFYQTTILPVTSSTNSWADTAHQTSWTVEAQRQLLLAWLRGGSFTAATGFIETTTAFETSLNSGIINAPGFTGDGLHPTTSAHIAIAAAVAPQVP